MTHETAEHTHSFDTLAERARNSGYRLIREHHEPPRWALLDAEDGEYLHTAATLAEIAWHLYG